MHSLVSKIIAFILRQSSFCPLLSWVEYASVANGSSASVCRASTDFDVSGFACYHCIRQKVLGMVTLLKVKPG